MAERDRKAARLAMVALVSAKTALNDTPADWDTAWENFAKVERLLRSIAEGAA